MKRKMLYRMIAPKSNLNELVGYEYPLQGQHGRFSYRKEMDGQLQQIMEVLPSVLLLPFRRVK